MRDEIQNKPLRKHRAPISRLTTALLAAAAVAVLLPGQAQAEPGYPFDPSFATSVDDRAAGAHPDLTIRLSKPVNSCDPNDPDTRIDPANEYWYICPIADVEAAGREQQDFKKLVMTLPEGMAPNPNAAPQCDPLEWPDTPRGFNPNDPEDQPLWWCPPETKIGTLGGHWASCRVEGGNENPGDEHCGFTPALIEAFEQKIYGEVYMGVPQSGEQGRLIILVGLDFCPDGYPFCEPPGLIELPGAARTDVRITVDSKGKITAAADGLPDIAVDITQGSYFAYMIQPHDIEMTLEGAVGTESRNPLLTNPTSCSKKDVSGEVQGYLYNTYLENGSTNNAVQGSGDGTSVSFSDRYYVTGCNQVPYAPQMSMTLDPPTPGANPAITSTITQASGEQNSDSVSVKFAKGFKINVQTKAAQCADDQFDQGGCPADSNIGQATAQSPLLPLTSAPLSGPVYLGQTDLAAGNIKLMTKLANDFLPNGITITGTSQLNADGTLQANFNDVPDLPISSFTLALEGGDKGLVKNPKTCGPKSVEGTFTSHQGKQVTSSPQVAIACDEASLQVDASTRRAKAHPTISLTASAASMQTLSFKLPSALRVARHSEQGKGYGMLTFLTEDGTTETKLDLLGSGKKKVSFSAVRAGHQVTAVTLRKKKANLVTLSNVPDGTISATLDLEGQKDNFLANPSSCRALQRTAKGKRRATGKPKDLNYSATVTNVEGKTMTPVLRTAMACGKRKAKRRS